MVITLTTDFGYQDPFVGIMKGVIAAINPQAQVIDISHGVPPQDIMAGALILQHAVPFFAAGTIHMVVVDPGVGAARKPILIEHQGNYFVGPDNGVLSLALDGAVPERIFELTERGYQLNNLSNTFHGRDLFAPAAAHLSLGVPATRFGAPLTTMVQLSVPTICRSETQVEGEIIYIDAFGNLFTNLRQRDLTGKPTDWLAVELAGQPIGGLTTSYAEVRVGEYACLFNSWDLLEIAVNGGNAKQCTGASIGSKVTVRFKWVKN